MSEATIRADRILDFPRPQAPVHVPLPFISHILRPYRANAQYLKSAQIDFVNDGSPNIPNENSDNCLIRGRGRFEIPASCYIDDTGHFNSVEFNICYNQLAYVLFGMSLVQGIWRQVARQHERLSNVSVADYQKHQLSSMLIVSLQASFRRELKSDSFWGEMKIERLSSKDKSDFIYTSIAFSDAEGVKSTGSVVLAFNPGSGT